MYKSSKYNFVLVILLIIIGAVVGVAPVFSAANTTPPLLEQDGNQELPEQEVSMPVGKFSPPSPTASPLTRILFAFKVLDEGDGFYSETTQRVLAMGQTQHIFTKSYRAGVLNAAEEWQYSNTSLAKNQFVLHYDSGTEIKSKVTQNKAHYKTSPLEYTFFDEQPKTYNTVDYVRSYNHFNNFPLTINSSNTEIKNYDRRTDPKNYVINVSFSNSKVNQTYIDLFKSNGTDNVVFTKIDIIFKIDKKTGFFTSIEKNEKFSTTYSLMPVTCDAWSIQRFTKVNTSMKAEIELIFKSNFK